MNAPEHPYAGKGHLRDVDRCGSATQKAGRSRRRRTPRRRSRDRVDRRARDVARAPRSKMATRSIVGTLGNAARVLATHGIRLIPWAYVVPGADHAEEAARLLEENAAACVSAWPCPWYEQAPAILDLDRMGVERPERRQRGRRARRRWKRAASRAASRATARRGALPGFTAPVGGVRGTLRVGDAASLTAASARRPDYPARASRPTRITSPRADRALSRPRRRAARTTTGASSSRSRSAADARGGLGWWSLRSMTPGRWAGIGDVEIPGVREHGIAGDAGDAAAPQAIARSLRRAARWFPRGLGFCRRALRRHARRALGHRRRRRVGTRPPEAIPTKARRRLARELSQRAIWMGASNARRTPHRDRRIDRLESAQADTAARVIGLNSASRARAPRRGARRPADEDPSRARSVTSPPAAKATLAASLVRFEVSHVNVRRPCGPVLLVVAVGAAFVAHFLRLLAKRLRAPAVTARRASSAPFCRSASA